MKITTSTTVSMSIVPELPGDVDALYEFLATKPDLQPATITKMQDSVTVDLTLGIEIDTSQGA